MQGRKIGQNLSSRAIWVKASTDPNKNSRLNGPQRSPKRGQEGWASIVQYWLGCPWMGTALEKRYGLGWDHFLHSKQPPKKTTDECLLTALLATPMSFLPEGHSGWHIIVSITPPLLIYQTGKIQTTEQHIL